MDKKEARKLYREKRNAITPRERSKLDDLLLIQFQSVELPFINNVLSYWPSEEHAEPNTHLFTRYLEFRYPGLQVLYPKLNRDSKEITALLVDEVTQFEQNAYHIYEPVAGEIVKAGDIDMVMVPLLSFDRKGYRIGFGKGFYDRFLSACDENCIKVGFSYFEPIEAISDCHQFDVPLNLCITPQTVYVF
jgi:5-formyltetrahydrofolate cyclo-ligase